MTLIIYDATFLKKSYYRHGNESGRETNDGDDGRGARGKIARVHYGWNPLGDKRRPGNLAIVGYRHPEVALIEIMIGELTGAEDEEGRQRDR